MSQGSSKGRGNEGNAPEPRDEAKESGEALEEAILKRYASKPEAPAEEPPDRPEEVLTGMEYIEKEIQERYAITDEDLESDQEAAPRADSISPEEEILRGYAPTEDEPSPDPGGEEEGTEATPLEEEVVEMPDLDEAPPPINDDSVEPSEAEEDDDHEGEEGAGEVASEEDMRSESELMPPSKAADDSLKYTPMSPEEVVRKLKTLREDVGQISELSSEEGSIVGALSSSFLKLMESFAKTLPMDVSILPRKMGAIESANVIPKGELVLLFEDGRMESVDLTDTENRDLLVSVLSDVMPKFNDLVTERRSKIEKRITFLSEVTKELQTIADALAPAG